MSAKVIPAMEAMIGNTLECIVADAGYRVAGVDRSQVLLDEARRRASSSRWPKLTRAELATDRSLAIASSSRTKPWSSTAIAPSGITRCSAVATWATVATGPVA